MASLLARLHLRQAPPGWEPATRLGRDERIVAWATSVDDTSVVATTKHLWWPDAGGADAPDDGAAPRSISWHLIAKAVWQDSWLSVTELDVIDDIWLLDRQAIRLRLSEPGNLPSEVRTRVERSVVRSETATVPGGTVRFVARKVAGEDGLRWWARLEGGAVRTPEIESAVRARLDRLRG